MCLSRLRNQGRLIGIVKKNTIVLMDQDRPTHELELNIDINRTQKLQPSIMVQAFFDRVVPLEARISLVHESPEACTGRIGMIEVCCEANRRYICAFQ